jgi:hypothetical protein
MNFMKQLIVIALSTVILYGCDPAYNCYVRNRSSSVLYLKTHPGVESLLPKESINYDSIAARKTAQEDKLSIYSVKPGETFQIYGHIGFSPSLEEVPFDHIEIIQKGDTVILDSKEKILGRLVQEGKTRKYFIQQ